MSKILSHINFSFPSNLMQEYYTVYCSIHHFSTPTFKALSIKFSSECLLNFLKHIYSTMSGKKFSIDGVHIPRKCIPGQKGWRKLWFALSKSKIKIRKYKMTWYISLFIFCMMHNFSKCDGFTVLSIISMK